MNYEALVVGDYILSQYERKFDKLAYDAKESLLSKELEWNNGKPTVVQIAEFVCEFYDVPRSELTQDRQLYYLVRIRRAIAFLFVRLYDPESLNILKHQIYQKKVSNGLRKELGKVINRTGSAISYMIRGAINEYLTDKQIKLLYHYLEYKLNIEYGHKA